MPISRPPVPERFQVAPRTLRFDRLMTWVIKGGGVGIILAVFGIFVFMVLQVLPLFHSASVEETGSMEFAPGPVPAAFGIDEWGELPFYYDGGKEVVFVDASGKAAPLRMPAPLPENATVTAASWLPVNRLMLIGTADGQVGSFGVEYSVDFDANQTRTVKATLVPGEFYEVGSRGPIRSVGLGDSGTTRVFAAIQENGGRREVHALRLQQKKSLMGKGKLTREADLDLTPLLTGVPELLRVPSSGDSILITTAAGLIDYVFLGGDQPEKRQEWYPFSEGNRIASIDFVFGDVSLVVTDAAGHMDIWSLLVPEGGDTRVFVRIKQFPSLKGGATFFARSQRNKLFLTGSGSQLSLRHSTTEQVRWEGDAGFEVRGAAIDAKGTGFVLLDSHGKLHRYALDDPHPEAGWRAFFGKVWYEGATHPEYTWQSTSGTDDFEPKLSLRPLIHGTLKGTFWAMLFAVPVALLAAIYTAQFLRPEIKRIVKPMMEIMASLPSVVLGFLAALWLAPLIESHVPSVFLILGGIPLIALLVGKLWSQLPPEQRARIPLGMEWVCFVPVMLLASWGLWQLGPLVEAVLFQVKDVSGHVLTDPVTGKAVADFRQWWPQVTGTPFDQRNSLVVGFMMGFAVIPVVFTIAEDALSNVPASLTAASAALGASRWQTLRTIVLPIASAGIFSALMIGLGRAVGETMIVVMATGNTPIVGSSRVDLQACKLEYSIVSPK